MLDAFHNLLGPKGIIAGEEMMPFLREWRGLYEGHALAVLKPSSTDEAAALVRLCRAQGLKIVPQGGNTGLVGGQMPQDAQKHVVVSTARMTAIRNVDATGNTMTVDAGVILERIQQEADRVDRLFPLALGSQGSCQIGGNIATNAGGTGVLAHGNTRDLVLGLEVVLPSGEIWNGLQRLRKNNTGYDLKHLFIGGEGTLGLITAATLKLFPKPRGQQVAFLGLASPHAALAVLNTGLQKAGGALTGFELMPRIGLDFALRHLQGARDPLVASYPWYLLAEISSGRSEDEAEALMAELFEAAFEAGHVEDGALAQSEDQRGQFWRLRHGLSEVQKHEGGSIKHDVSVPVARMPDFILEASALVERVIPNCRPVPFGHLGDGNIHFNISQPVGADKEAFLARWDEVNEAVHALVVDYDGSVSAEHGIGRLKAKLMPQIKSATELAMMRQIKAALDPDDLFNPGALLPSSAACFTDISPPSQGL